MKNKFKEILSEILEIEVDKINEQTSLNEDNWSSLTIISFIDEIFQEYDIELNGQDLEEINSVKDLHKKVFKHED